VVVAPALQFIDHRDLQGLIGRNIFDVDLAALRRKLSRKYPQASSLRVLRLFPDRISVAAKQRLPFTQMRVDAGAVILDDEGVVLSLVDAVDKNLPMITGKVLAGQEVVRGLPLKGEDIQVALKIMSDFYGDSSFSSYTISEINIENLSKIYFSLSNGLEVFIDRGRVSHKLKVLSVVLSREELDPRHVKYVDLRFKEPVIGKK
jgi:cell division septal protein FtsQ